MSIVRRLGKQHRCIVLVLPHPVCRELGLAAGDYVEVSTDRRRRAAVVTKLKLGGTEHGRSD
jgi:bifunctional DNA-binding transcriptional regulator/antitoxin component of YhaV-PrlF toxin-antitoxin module